MSDLLEDQKIHYIVKDYQRMYNGFHALVQENKELRGTVEQLKRQVANLQEFKKKKLEKQVVVMEKKAKSSTLSTLNDSLAQINSLHNKALAFVTQLEKLTTNINVLDKIIRT